MRSNNHMTNVSLFPFISVLICTMGVLAFISISFLLIIPNDYKLSSKSKQKKFEWIGAPSYVKPIYFYCYKNRIEYYNLFEKKKNTLFLNSLLRQIEDDEEEPEILKYLFQLLESNINTKKNFGNIEYYPLLLVYPDGILTSELIMNFVEKIQGLNFGIEPMLSNIEIPYQDLHPK